MDISLFMSAARPQWWQRIHKSLLSNACDWEIVAVGPNPPKWQLPANFRYYHCPYKPAQCYAAASNLCRGELIGYTADDATYGTWALDKIWNAYRNPNSKKAIFAQRTIEDGKDVVKSHHFFWNCQDTPTMAPLAFMNREWFMKLGGYDKNYISGQAENDIVMNALADGGRIEPVMSSEIYLHHTECHRVRFRRLWRLLGLQEKIAYPFRAGYVHDRTYLENCWVKEGYGTYNEKTLAHGTISKVRLIPHQPFEYSNILTVPNGPQGAWENK